MLLLAKKGLITIALSVFSFVIYKGAANEIPQKLPTLSSVVRGGQLNSEKTNTQTIKPPKAAEREHKLEKVNQETILEKPKNEQIAIPAEVSIKKVVYKPIEQVSLSSSEDTPSLGSVQRNTQISENPAWITHLLKTLGTPMYSRGTKSFIHSLKIEFPIEFDSKLETFQKFKSENSDKRSYSINLDTSKVIEQAELYQNISSLAQLWFENKDWASTISYKVEHPSSFKGLQLIFLKTYKEKEYSLTIEYSYDSQNSAPILHSNYVWYKDSNWWRGVYYQAEKGRGYQKHIGKTDSHIRGNPNSPINLSLQNTFMTGNWENLTRWWELLSKCSEDTYCRRSLTDIKSTYIQLPINYYRETDNKHSAELHPLVLLWNQTFQNKEIK